MYNAESIALFNKANTLYKGKLYAQALDLYKKSVQIEPAFYEAHFCVAKTLARLRQANDAIAVFKQNAGLIPQNELNQYVLAFLNILTEEKQNLEAIQWINSFNFPFSEAIKKKYLNLLLVENQKSNFYNKTLAYFTLKKAKAISNEIISHTNISENIKKEIETERFFEKLEKLSSNLKQQEKLNILDTSLSQSIKANIQTLKIIAQGKDNTPFATLQTIEQKAIKNLDAIFELSKKEDVNSLTLKNIRKILKDNAYDTKKQNQVQQKINEFNAIQRKKSIKTVLIFFGLSALFMITALVYYYFSAKSEAYEWALQSNNIEYANHYLAKYGDDVAVHTKRERLMYQNAVQQNTSESIIQLRKNYPKSKYLRKIHFNTKGNEKIEVFGLKSSYHNLKELEENTYLLPYGCVVGIKSSHKYTKYSRKYFRVSKHTNINLNTHTPKDTMYSNRIYYVNASKLNVRTRGYAHASVVEQIKIGEPVIYLGEHSAIKSKAQFLDEELEDYYYKIQTENQMVGWVHGAGLNNLSTNTPLTFTDFNLGLEAIIENYTDTFTPIEEEEILPINSEAPTTHNTDTLIEYPTAEDTIQEENTQATTAIEAIQEEPKTTRTTCRQCKGKGTYKTNCPNTNCEYGFISTTCSTCGGNYRSGTSLCTNAGCNYQGCEYCDYDGAACAQCTRGKVTIEHAQCNGTSKINKRCNACKGKGYIIK